MLQVRDQLIIRHPSKPAILMMSDAGNLRLPAFTSHPRHTAEVDYINLEVRERIGLQTTVLRSLRHSEPLRDIVVRLHELEAHGEDAPLPFGMCWCRRGDLPSAVDREDADAIAAWLAAEPAPDPAFDGRDWTLPGWFEEARGWLDRKLGDIGVVEVVQLRAWPSSCMLLVHTKAGAFYFKAVAQSSRRECTVTAYLAGHFPGATAAVVAVEPERRWFLMSALGGRKLEDVGDVAIWAQAAAAYGGLQVTCQERVHDLRALGCPTRGLDALAKEMKLLSADAAALRPGEPGGLSAAEADRLGACVPELQRRCERLAA